MSGQDWTFGFCPDDIAHKARFLGCSDVQAARQLQSEWLAQFGERIGPRCDGCGESGCDGSCGEPHA